MTKLFVLFHFFHSCYQSWWVDKGSAPCRPCYHAGTQLTEQLQSETVPCCRCCSVSQSYPTLCDSMVFSMPGLPVPHHLPEFAKVHVHCISDAIQPSHPLWVRSWGRENSLEKEVTIHSSILAWEIPWTEEPGRL